MIKIYFLAKDKPICVLDVKVFSPLQVLNEEGHSLSPVQVFSPLYSEIRRNVS